MKTVISIENLSKYYRLGTIGNQTLYEDLNRWWARQRGQSDPTLKVGEANYGNRDGEYIWALRDVSLQVKQGEVLGIIGRNGAGKSTLLKILSQVTAPTSGNVKVRGRIASLLEVGSGFHGDLTGRENIYLNGAIMGMTRAEIKRKLDEIVDFSGVENFINTPVKRYSSGMHVRLAFAVAAHLEPEILIVDEVLAVGDTNFQKKSIGKMNDVASDGRTVLFVSHNMTAITRLCQRVVLLEGGKVKVDGNPGDVITQYLTSTTGSMAVREWPDVETAPGKQAAKLRAVRIYDETGMPSSSIDIRKPIRVEMEFDVLEGGHKFVPNFHFYTGDGTCAFVSYDQDPQWKGIPRLPGHYKSSAWIPGNFLAEGTMTVTVALSVLSPVEVEFALSEAVAFQVVDSLDGNSMRGDYGGAIPGIVRPRLKWTTSFEKSD